MDCYEEGIDESEALPLSLEVVLYLSLELNKLKLRERSSEGFLLIMLSLLRNRIILEISDLIKTPSKRQRQKEGEI